MKTKTKISGIDFESFVCNASGPKDTTIEQLETIAKSDSSAIIMKSCTIEPREGNSEPRYSRLPLGSIQSMGLPNLGYKKYIEFIPILKKFNKPIIASVVGFNLDEVETLVKEFQKSEVDLIEVNLSCPNIVGKSMVAYDLESSKKYIEKISNLGEKPVGLKLPPYFDSSQRKEMANLIKKYNISFVTLINSIGDSLYIDPLKETPIIKPKSGLGGLCGSYIKPVALANVRDFYNELKETKISIFGVGGISSGTDAFEFLLAGADAVQIATIFEIQGPQAFERINNELKQFLLEKGYGSIQDAKGKLKYI